MADDDSDSPEKNNVAKELRRQAVIVRAIKGQGVGEIAKAVGISRSAASRIINTSEELKTKIEATNLKLAEGIDDAVQTILTAVKTDYLAARDLLSHFLGYAKQKVELEKREVSLVDLIVGSYKDERNPNFKPNEKVIEEETKQIEAPYKGEEI